MASGKLMTFFMLVTERDCVIADFAIKSYEKIYDRKQKFGYNDFTLFIYLNCLSPDSKNEYLNRWSAFPFTQLYDNAAKQISRPYPGEQIVSPEGIARSRDDYAESYDELWTTELKQFDTPFIATVDADFEILDADFYFYLMEQLEANPGHVGASSSHDPAKRLFDSYSQRNIYLQQRNHTWFCIYRKEAFDISVLSHFYYEEISPEGEILAYDSAAYFQHDLRVRHHRSFASPPPEYLSSFLHFGAASKNKSLHKGNINHYRKAFILCSIGIYYGKPKNFLQSIINQTVRKISRRRYGAYLNAMTTERSTYIFQEKENTSV